jgi:hypothetical protein
VCHEGIFRDVCSLGAILERSRVVARGRRLSQCPALAPAAWRRPLARAHVRAMRLRARLPLAPLARALLSRLIPHAIRL